MIVNGGHPERNTPMPPVSGVDQENGIMFRLKAWDDVYQSTPSSLIESAKQLLDTEAV